MTETEETSSKELFNELRELLLKFTGESTFLFVAVKLPGEIPLVLPIEIDVDLPTFIQDFDATWKDLGDKTRNEFIRGATSGRAT